jgi:hypothetical protein
VVVGAVKELISLAVVRLYEVAGRLAFVERIEQLVLVLVQPSEPFA